MEHFDPTYLDCQIILFVFLLYSCPHNYFAECHCIFTRLLSPTIDGRRYEVNLQINFKLGTTLLDRQVYPNHFEQ